jgi:hypothetical protein
MISGMDPWDLAAVAGVALIAAGVWMIYRPRRPDLRGRGARYCRDPRSQAWLTVGIFASLFHGGIRAAAPGPLDGFWYAPPGVISAAGKRVSAETAMRITTVYACVKLLAETVAELPLKIYRRRADDGKDVARNHPLYDVLHTRPNRWQTAFEFREMMMGHLLLRGNAYAEIVPGSRGAVDQLVPRHPDRMRVVQNASGSLVYEHRPQLGKPRLLLQDEARRGSFESFVTASTRREGARATGLIRRGLPPASPQEAAGPAGARGRKPAFNDSRKR